MSLDPAPPVQQQTRFTPRVVERGPLVAADESLRAGAAGLRYRTLLRFGVTPWLLVADALSVVLAVELVAHRPSWAAATYLVLLLGLLQHRGLLRGRLTLSLLDDSPALVARSLAAAVGATLVADALAPDAHRDTGMLLVLIVQLPLLLTLRSASYELVRAVRRARVVEHPTLVLGAGHVGGQIAAALLEHPDLGLLPVGFLDDNPLLARHERVVPVLGSVSELAKVLVEFRIRNVIVAFGSGRESDMVDVLRTCDRHECEILVVPRLFEVQHTGRGMESAWGVPLMRLRRAAFRRPSWKLKRVMDVVLSGAALLALAPVLGICALAVRLETGPGVLFRQTRVGMDGRPFELLKFRSLKPVDSNESQTRWNVAHDDRLGKIGRVLRQTSLDELPQLWNILRGDMTLVGPRPERPHFVEQFTTAHARYSARHRVPAGLTGWAQIHGLRGDTSIADRARFDNAYIENWSLWGDVKIMLRTVLAAARRQGA